ncbi:MAG: Uma2 family endonuclease [Oscillatoriales cyanobacterium]|nr:MAG: Uma2 family endonuclease [Oscillatoriales cyanobacterium]TAH18214.1 MAG: Uma2 family endonuclease [Oscillatoriales cyanobacterium]
MVFTALELAAIMPDASKIESDEPEMESSLHYLQLSLLVACLEWLWRDRNNFFIGANLTVYYSEQQLRNRDFRGPDFFLVRNTEKRPRRSWVVWQEDGKYPDVIIELLSESTAKVDRNAKKILYQNRFRTPEYFWFDPEDFELAGFRLIGQEYQAIVANESGRLWSQILELYLGIYEGKLRYFSQDGELVPTPEEAALQAQEQAEQAQEQAQQAQEQAQQAQEQAQQAQQRVERLADQLRALGIEPE